MEDERSIITWLGDTTLTVLSSSTRPFAQRVQKSCWETKNQILIAQKMSTKRNFIHEPGPLFFGLTPVELWPLHPEELHPQMGRHDEDNNGLLLYMVLANSNKTCLYDHSKTPENCAFS